MALTAQEAYNQLSAEIKKLGGWKPGNVLDGIIGVGKANTDQLQQMLNQVLQKNGILSAGDEANIKGLLDQQEKEKKKRQAIRAKNFLLLGGTMVAIGGIIYLVAKKMKT
jgi:hypothetical protein